MRVAKIVAVIVLVPVVGVPALLGLMWLDHFRETRLPQLTGPFAVGRMTYAWKDPAHTDPLATAPGARRELLAWIWYPAIQSSQVAEDYLPAPWRTALESHSGALLTQFLTRDLSRVRAHSTRDAELSPQQPSYPVVLMRAGLAKQTTDYTALAEDLASHGYVVVGFDAPYRTIIVVLPDGTGDRARPPEQRRPPQRTRARAACHSIGSGVERRYGLGTRSPRTTEHV